MPKILNIRGVDDAVARAISGGAAVRGMTQAEYLKRLVALHKFVRCLDWDMLGCDPHDPEDAAMRWVVTGADPADVVSDLGNYLRDERMWDFSA